MMIKNFLKRFGVFFGNLLFPPKCVGCKEFIQKDIFDECKIPFCEKCRVKWEYEKLDICPDCGLEMTLCNCGTKLLKKSGVEDYIKLANYSVAKKSVGKSAVLYMKRHKNDRALNYFADQLSYPVSRKIKTLEGKRAVFTYVPRSKKSVTEYGFDQARELSKRIAARCDAEFIPLFERSGVKTTEQKKLKMSERVKNAKMSYRLNVKNFQKLSEDDCIFIVDDVLTSGASVLGCLSVLKPKFEGEVVCVTVARTGKSRKK